MNVYEDVNRKRTIVHAIQQPTLLWHTNLSSPLGIYKFPPVGFDEFSVGEVKVFVTIGNIYGFKAFEPDMTCRCKKYKVGETFEEDLEPVPCANGMHFCTTLMDTLNYYPLRTGTHFCLVMAEGGLNATRDFRKFCTNRLKILRELEMEEVLELVRCDIYDAVSSISTNPIGAIPIQLYWSIAQGAYNELRGKLMQEGLTT